MPDLPSFSQLFRVARDEALARNGRLSRDAIERDGMDANILIATATAIGDEIGGQIADLQAALFLGSAVKENLDRLVFDRYGLTRKPAAASVGSINFTTTVASAVTFSIPAGTVVQTATGIQFVTTESGVFPVGSVGPLTLAIRSVLAGDGQDAKVGTVTSLISQIISAPTDLQITNPFATVGGAPEESDDSLRERARRFFVTARKGTIAALEAAALGVPGIQTATAFEVLDALGRPARLVQLVVADAFTEQFVNFDTAPPRFEVQSQAITTAVNEALADVRAAGIFVQVIVSNVVIQPVQLALTFQAGANVNDSALQARAAVVNLINALAPGAPLSAQALLNVLRLVPGLRFTGDEIISPPGDIIATPLQVLRTSLGLVTAVGAQTDTPIITGNNPDAFVVAST